MWHAAEKVRFPGSRRKVPSVSDFGCYYPSMADIESALDVGLGSDEMLSDEDQLAVMTLDGRAAIVPKSMQRMSREQLAAVITMQGIVRRMLKLQDELYAAVADARDLRVSWDAIGWSIGTTGRAANMRFNDRPREPR